jgi:hypothetical protein
MEWDPVDRVAPVAERCRLRGVFSAFAGLGVRAVPVVYSDDRVEEVRDQLLSLDGVLVWVNPIEQGRDRSRLDSLLREVGDAGVWVSAHPDVILKVGTKQVLIDTAGMSWSAGTHLYSTHDQLRAELPTQVSSGAVVLKQHRGNGGEGVWKVELARPGSGAAEETLLRVQHAARGSVPEDVSLVEFLARCEPYFGGGGSMVEQEFQPRLDEGMIRVYLSHDQVVGFAHQYPFGLMPPRPSDDSAPAQSKVFELASTPRYQHLRKQMELEWLPELQSLLDIDKHELPVVWDADFLYGDRTAAGDDTYILCEINASSTFAFPEHAMPTVAQAALDRLRERADQAGDTRQTRAPTAGGGAAVAAVGYRGTDMAAVQLKCDIDGCGMSWSVSAREMKASMAEHRQKFHPDSPQPKPKGPTPRRSLRA